MQALKNMIGRAILNLINDAAATQTVTLEAQAGDVHDEVELFQPFGFSAHPPVGSEAVVVFVAGNHDHPIALCAEHKGTRRNNLAEGEAAVYNLWGHHITLYKDKCVIETPVFEVNAKQSVTIKAPKITLDGEVDGTKSAVFAQDVKDQGGRFSMGWMRALFNRHTHHENDGGGNTDQPNEQME